MRDAHHVMASSRVTTPIDPHRPVEMVGIGGHGHHRDEELGRCSTRRSDRPSEREPGPPGDLGAHPHVAARHRSDAGAWRMCPQPLSAGMSVTARGGDTAGDLAPATDAHRLPELVGGQFAFLADFFAALFLAALFLAAFFAVLFAAVFAALFFTAVARTGSEAMRR